MSHHLGVFSDVGKELHDVGTSPMTPTSKKSAASSR